VRRFPDWQGTRCWSPSGVEGTRLDRDASPDVPRLCGVAIGYQQSTTINPLCFDRLWQLTAPTARLPPCLFCFVCEKWKFCKLPHLKLWPFLRVPEIIIAPFFSTALSPLSERICWESCYRRAPLFYKLELTWPVSRQTTQKLSDVTDDVIITFLMHFWIDLSVPDIFDMSLVTQFLIMTEIWLIIDFKISSPHHRHPEFFVTMEFVSDFSKSDWKIISSNYH
jgi:hypothetical protein